MSWSYSGDPSTSDKDAVRFLVGDTDSEDELLEDEEIEYLLTRESNPTLAAAIAAETIAAEFARKADRTIGDYSEKYSQKSENYFNLATKLRDQSSHEKAFKAIPFAGGISKSQKETLENNDDRVKPAFKRDMMDNKGGLSDGELICDD